MHRTPEIPLQRTLLVLFPQYLTETESGQPRTILLSRSACKRLVCCPYRLIQLLIKGPAKVTTPECVAKTF
jgi:hypothetical protein